MKEYLFIKLYYNHIENEWTHLDIGALDRRSLDGLVLTQIHKDIMGKEQIFYRLNAEGIKVAEIVIAKHGMDCPPFRGVAIERREWISPKTHRYAKSTMVAAMREIAQRGEVPMRTQPGIGPRQTRIIFTDLDRCISRISSEIKWENNKHQTEEWLMYTHNFSGAAAWVWIHMFEPNRKDIRSLETQQEFVIWGT